MKAFLAPNARKSFGAKKNMVRHLNTVHKASEGGSDRNLDEPHNELTKNNIPYMDMNSVNLENLLVMPLDPLN